MGAIALSPSPAFAADLTEQLRIPLNNGTRSESRDQADRWLRLGQEQAATLLLSEAAQSWQQALRLYIDLGDREAQNLIYGYLGTTYYSLGNYVAAEDSFRRRLSLSRDRQGVDGQIHALNSLARILIQRGGTSDAETLLNEALALSTRTNSQEGIAATQASFGLLAYTLGNYDRAITHYQASLNGTQRSFEREAAILNNLATAFQAKGDSGNAQRYFESAVRVANTASDRTSQIRALDGLVAISQQTGNYPQALRLLSQRLALAQALDNPRQELASYQAIAQLYQTVGDQNAARLFYHQALAVAQEIQDIDQERLLVERLTSLKLRRSR
jgi:tetratricopeptide (TPR) repeat protein